MMMNQCFPNKNNMIKMKNTFFKYLFLIITASVMFSCTDDILPFDESDESKDKTGDVLNLTVTLDAMGNDPNNPLAKIENYIDPQKFRVLFFSCEKDKDGKDQDLFLFESKSRWVKKLKPDDIFSEWQVSVPLFTYGNDTEDDWEWEKIRKKITEGPFKVAVLVNRPLQEWYPGFKNTGFEGAENEGWLDNRGPFWSKENSVVFDENDPKRDVKDVFDLHHSQYDKLYHAKGFLRKNSTPGSDLRPDDENDFYDFIMADYDRNGKPKMSATSSWTDWNVTYTVGDKTYERNRKGWMNTQNNTPLVHYVHPTEEHPIPMYGIQKFNQIDSLKWKRGTTFYLSDINGNKTDENYTQKSISLLRSVVRLDLIIPKSAGKPDFVQMCYPNIYSRCEPMDVWTPTDELWEKYCGWDDDDCELNDIMKHGPIATSSPGAGTKKEQFQNRIKWFYGAWLDRGWDFKDKDGSVKAKPTTENAIDYPRIFNPCTQRNTTVLCEFEECDVTDLYNDGYYHFVVYTGERNLNDPSDLPGVSSTGGGKPTAQYWMFNIGATLYGVALADYNVSGSPTKDIVTVEYPNYLTNVDYSNPNNTLPPPPNTHEYMNGEGSYPERGYQQALMGINGSTDYKKLPWPLIRNHVYRQTLSFSGAQSRGGGKDMTIVKSEVLTTKNIGFKNNKKEEKTRHSQRTK